jgi:hypothetical protein
LFTSISKKIPESDRCFPGLYQKQFKLRQKRITSVRGDRNDADFALLFAELDSSIAESEKGVITTAADVDAGTETGAALTDDDGTGSDALTTESLDSEKLRFTVAAVTAAGLTFLMCHDKNSCYIKNFNLFT